MGATESDTPWEVGLRGRRPKKKQKNKNVEGLKIKDNLKTDGDLKH